jgi:hypothetical protein
MKKLLPFSIIKRADRPSFLVSFKSEKTGAYMPPISTRQTDESAAIKTAWEWYRQGVSKSLFVPRLAALFYRLYAGQGK